MNDVRNPAWLDCVGVGIIVALCLGILIGPLGGVFGLYLEKGAVLLFALIAGGTGAFLFSLHQRLKKLEQQLSFFKKQSDSLCEN